MLASATRRVSPSNKVVLRYRWERRNMFSGVPKEAKINGARKGRRVEKENRTKKKRKRWRVVFWTRGMKGLGRVRSGDDDKVKGGESESQLQATISAFLIGASWEVEFIERERVLDGSKGNGYTYWC